MHLLCHWVHYACEKLSRGARCWACDWIIEHRRCSTLGHGRGNCPLNLGLAPQIFQHIGAKSSILWPSKYTKMHFRLGLRPGLRWRSSCTTLPQNYLVGWEGDMILQPSALTTKTLCLGLVGGIAPPPPKYFPLEQHMMEHLTLPILYY